MFNAVCSKHVRHLIISLGAAETPTKDAVVENALYREFRHVCFGVVTNLFVLHTSSVLEMS